MLRSLSFVTGLLCCSVVYAQTFSDQVGAVSVGTVKPGVVQVPYLTWGGDVATFHANGGLKTASGSIYKTMGLDLQLVPGDDFQQQVRDYVSGKSPYLRGTMRMVSQASEMLSDPRTKPIVILQLTWSAGDHMVSRGTIKDLSDLKGRKIALQRGGPHMDLLDDALRSANIAWADVEIVWCKDLTASEDSPAAKFRDDPTIDAACVISPDMIGLTGGLDSVGTGAEGTVRDSKVLVSTAQMSRSIADVYCVRSDYFQSNREQVEKFVAGYLKASLEIVTAQKAYNDGAGSSPEYVKDLKLAQSIFGEEVLPTIEVDAYGLLLDAAFVGLPGNVSFFTDKGNLNGFEPKQKAGLDLAAALGLAKTRVPFVAANFDYKQIATIAGLPYDVPAATAGRIKVEVEDWNEADLDDSTLLTFNINFKPNSLDFSVEEYGEDFQRVVENASTFGNAAFVVRGHVDPTLTVRSFIKAGLASGTITQEGTKENRKYKLKGRDLDRTNLPFLIEEINRGSFRGSGEDNPQEMMQAALNTSYQRASAVKAAIVKYAKEKGLNLDDSQIQPQGVGIREPINPTPKNPAEALVNMRVEFRLIKVDVESLDEGDFDF